jgi:hypothetical protein
MKTDMTSSLFFRKPLRAAMLAAVLAMASLASQAALVTYTGQTDPVGPLPDTPFSGSFSYADPVAGFDGSVALDNFTLDFAGQSYTLAGADAPAVAWFVGGIFVGIDYIDLDSASPAVAFTAGFADLSEASFSYFVGDSQGLGGFTTLTTVPEPATATLLLAALGLAAIRRRRPQG